MRPLLNHNALSIVFLALAGAYGCASHPQSTTVVSRAEPVTPAASEVVGAEEQVSFFVNDARSGEIDKVRAALEAGVPVDHVDAVDQSALIAAAGKNHLDVVRLLLERGANPNFRDPAGWTPLIHATYFGSSLELISLLVEKGANINHQNDRGVTALYLAAAAGHEAYVRHLLALGADRSLATKSGYTPLRIAQINGLAQIVSLLEAQPTAAGTPTAKL